MPLTLKNFHPLDFLFDSKTTQIKDQSVRTWKTISKADFESKRKQLVRLLTEMSKTRKFLSGSIMTRQVWIQRKHVCQITRNFSKRPYFERSSAFKKSYFDSFYSAKTSDSDVSAPSRKAWLSGNFCFEKFKFRTKNFFCQISVQKLIWISMLTSNLFTPSVLFTAFSSKRPWALTAYISSSPGKKHSPFKCSNESQCTQFQRDLVFRSHSGDPFFSLNNLAATGGNKCNERISACVPQICGQFLKNNVMKWKT